MELASARNAASGSFATDVHFSSNLPAESVDEENDRMKRILDTRGFGRHAARRMGALAICAAATACSGRTGHDTNDAAVAEAAAADVSNLSDKDAGAESGSPSTFDQACADIAAGVCRITDSCFGQIGIEGTWGDASTCLAETRSWCVNFFGPNGSNSTTDGVERCALFLASASCDDYFFGGTRRACSSAGTLAQGAHCVGDNQCAGENSYCHFSGDPTTACGVCATTVGLGSSCGPADKCDTGLVCANASGGNSGGTCIPVGQLGSPCAASNTCSRQLTCLRGFCAAPAGAGDSCSPQDQNCDSTQGLYCDNRTGSCVQYQVVPIGASCALLPDAAVADCADNGACDGGICQPAAAHGAMCNRNGGPYCVPSDVCVNGACTVPVLSDCQ